MSKDVNTTRSRPVAACSHSKTTVFIHYLNSRISKHRLVGLIIQLKESRYEMKTFNHALGIFRNAYF